MNMVDQLAQDQFTADEYVDAERVIEDFYRDKPETIAIDTESKTFRWFLADAPPFAFQCSWGRENTYYVDVRPQLEQERIASWLVQLFEAANRGEVRVLFHNSKYDIHVVRRMARDNGIELPELGPDAFEDTMILSHNLDEQRFHGLKELCDTYGIKYDDADASFLKDQIHGWLDEESKRQNREVGFDEVPDYLMVPYSIQDGYLTWALWNQFSRELEEADPEGKDIKRIYRLEKELVPVLVEAEEHGMRIDPDFVYDQLATLGPQLQALRVECLKELGLPADEPFNPGSTEEVAAALKKFDLIDDEAWKNPATGKYKLPEWVLESIDHPVAKLVLEYRLAQKMLTSYFEPLEAFNYDDGTGQRIVSCNIKQMGTRTGRMSITEPALQTIPREKGNVRGAFIAREGHDLIFADWSQQELRVLAHYMSYSDDSMLKILSTDGADLHLETAAAIYEKDPADVTREERGKAKAVNFAITYGAGQARLSTMLGVPLHEGKKLLNKYHRRFPGIRWMKKTAEARMKNRQYVVTMFGRRHRERDGKFAYKATNSIIQGTSADMAKTAMVNVRKRFKAEGMKSVVVLQIHDELVVESPKDETERAVAIVSEVMCDFPEFRLPITVECTVAQRWSEAKE